MAGWAGKFLTDQLGMALDQAASLIPYDSIFAPMAKVMKEIDYGLEVHQPFGFTVSLGTAGP